MADRPPRRPNDDLVEGPSRAPKGEDLSRPGGGGGSGGTGCTATNEVIQFVIGGSPTGGTWDLELSVSGASAETLTFNWDDTAAEVQTELLTHTGIASGDVSCTGGPFPDAAISVEFTGDLAATDVCSTQPEWDFASLTGGSGVVVLVTRWTKGLAG